MLKLNEFITYNEINAIRKKNLVIRQGKQVIRLFKNYTLRKHQKNTTISHQRIGTLSTQKEV